MTPPADKPVADLSLDELRIAVAVEVMGWSQVSEGEPYFWPTPEMVKEILAKHPDVIGVDYFPAPDFPRDISAAWVVVLHLKSKGYDVSVSDNADDYWKSECRVDFNDETFVSVTGRDTAPIAICCAALLAVRKEGEK